jgi:hypothetical protein
MDTDSRIDDELYRYRHGHDNPDLLEKQKAFDERVASGYNPQPCRILEINEFTRDFLTDLLNTDGT